MSHKMLRPFIVKVSVLGTELERNFLSSSMVLGYFPLYIYIFTKKTYRLIAIYDILFRF